MQINEKMTRFGTAFASLGTKRSQMKRNPRAKYQITATPTTWRGPQRHCHMQILTLSKVGIFNSRACRWSNPGHFATKSVSLHKIMSASDRSGCKEALLSAHLNSKCSGLQARELAMHTTPFWHACNSKPYLGKPRLRRRQKQTLPPNVIACNTTT